MKKRKLLVGVIEPRELEGNIIYVTVSYWKDEQVFDDMMYLKKPPFAEAVSLEKFKISENKNVISSVKGVNSSNLHTDAEGLIKLIAKENNLAYNCDPRLLAEGAYLAYMKRKRLMETEFLKPKKSSLFLQWK